MKYSSKIPKRRVNAIEAALAAFGCTMTEIAAVDGGLEVEWKAKDGEAYRAQLTTYHGRWSWWTPWLGQDGTPTTGRRVNSPAAAIRDWLRHVELFDEA